MISENRTQHGDGLWLYYLLKQNAFDIPLIIFSNEVSLPVIDEALILIDKKDTERLLRELEKRLFPLVKLKDFKFNSLRKYMAPLYAELNLHKNEDPEFKKKIVAEKIREFYRRIRKYRAYSLAEVSERCGISLADLEAFDRGERDHDKRLIFAYVRACGADLEHDFFIQKLFHFKDGSELPADLLKSALQKGYVLPGIDYQGAFATKGKVLRFSRDGQSTSDKTRSQEAQDS